ncbi:putative 7-deoxyloganetin glucosyltransferase [Sesbania bispinosa]|nr:putative 7-deoxyloganetin glucosyltransferase [Sesbania bispinosa]
MAQLPCDDKGVCMVCKSPNEGREALETDASLSREEKNKKQQDLMSGKAGKAVEEKRQE